MSAPSPLLAADAFGRVVRRARRDRDLSQEALAAIAGIGAKHLGEIERGAHDPRFTTVLKLASALGLRPSELLSLYEERLER
jgi:transcriptional regulator with XRE-family HTH domain